MPSDFRHGLFGCFDSLKDCLLAYCCPDCYAFCAAQAAGEDTLMSALNCLFYPWCLCCLRKKIREQKGIDGSPIKDCLITTFCSCCAAIQIKREFD